MVYNKTEMGDDDNHFRNVITHEFKRRVKVVLVGNQHVGRTSFFKTVSGFNDFVPSDKKNFVLVGMPHITDCRSNQVNLELDCSPGHNRFTVQWGLAYRMAMAVFIFFDLTDRQSFEDVRNWAGDVVRYAPDYTVMILVGTKSDLHSDREVTSEEARTVAKNIGAVHYYETNKFDPGQKRQFEQLLVDVIYHYSDSMPDMSINVNFERSRQLAPFSDVQPPPSLTNLQMAKFRHVFSNKMISNVIFENVNKIHVARNLLSGKLADDLFMCTHHYYNVFTYKLAKSIPFTVPISNSSFFELIRNCPDLEIVKHAIRTLSEDDLKLHSVRIADEISNGGDITLLKWVIKDQDLRCSTRALRYAIVAGDLQLIEFIIKSHTTKKPKLQTISQFTVLIDSERIELSEFAKAHKQPEAEKYFKSYKLATSSFFNKIKIKIR